MKKQHLQELNKGFLQHASYSIMFHVQHGESVSMELQNCATTLAGGKCIKTVMVQFK
jgi:hypothetical protein